MLTTRVRILVACSMSAVLSACSSSPTTSTPAPGAHPVPGSAGGYLFLVDSLQVQQPGEWVATVVVRRGLELWAMPAGAARPAART